MKIIEEKYCISEINVFLCRGMTTRLVSRFLLHGFYFRSKKRICKLSVDVIFLLLSRLSKESFIYFIYLHFSL